MTEPHSSLTRSPVLRWSFAVLGYRTTNDAHAVSESVPKRVGAEETPAYEGVTRVLLGSGGLSVERKEDMKKPRLARRLRGGDGVSCRLALGPKAKPAWKSALTLGRGLGLSVLRPGCYGVARQLAELRGFPRSANSPRSAAAARGAKLCRCYR